MWMKTTILENALCIVTLVFNLRTPTSCAACGGAVLGMNQGLFE